MRKEPRIQRTKLEKEQYILIKQYENKLKKKQAKNKRKKVKKKKTYKNAFQKKKEAYYKYLKSEQWMIIRKEMIFQRGGVCELCQSKSELQVHHLHYKNIFNEKAEDLQVLCRECHEEVHHKI